MKQVILMPSVASHSQWIVQTDQNYKRYFYIKQRICQDTSLKTFRLNQLSCVPEEMVTLPMRIPGLDNNRYKYEQLKCLCVTAYITTARNASQKRQMMVA